MPTAISRVSATSKNVAFQRQRKKRNYPGELAAKNLIAWLNEPDVQLKEMLDNPPTHLKNALQQNKVAFVAVLPKARERRERVETIIRSWQSITKDASELHQWHSNSLPDTKPWKMDGGIRIRGKLERAMNRLNSLLKRYAGRRELRGIDYTNKSLVKIVESSHAKSGNRHDIRDSQGEWNSIGIIAELAAIGLIGKIHRCEQCGRWLFRRFAHQTCCSGRCRERKYRSTEEWKKHRRDWQRKNYRAHKALDQGREE